MAGGKVLQVVLASTTDLKVEGEKVRALVSELNQHLAARCGTRLELYEWHTDSYPTFHPVGSDGLANRQLAIADCDVFIGVFWRRLGAPTRTGVTGAEHEISAAYASWKRRQRPRLRLYFSREPWPLPGDDSDQRSGILQLKRNFAENELWWAYGNDTELAGLIRQQLSSVLLHEGSPRPEAADVLTAPARLYDFTKPVSDPRMFIGRQEIKDDILQGVGRGDSYAIIGGTRSGKTSLLFEVKRVLLGQLEASGGCVVGPVFLSTHQFTRLSQVAIYREIILNFKNTVCPIKFPKLHIADEVLFEPSLSEERAFSAFQQVLENIIHMLSLDLRIVIMVDEIDELQRHEWSNSFFNNFRHLISQSTLRHNISMLISGTLAIYSLYKVAGSPFLNVISGTKKLRLLTPAESAELVSVPTEHQIDGMVVDYIYRQTGGQPFLIQYIMKNLCDQYPSRLRMVRCEDVDRIVEKFFEERQDFNNWAAKFKSTDGAVYRLLASRAEPVKKAELVQTINNADGVNDSLELLAHFGVIREVARNTYAASGRMFQTWFENVSEDSGHPGITGAN